MIKKIKQVLFLLSATMVLVSCSDDDQDNGLIACTAETETGMITQVSSDESHVYTSIVINATPNQVWSVLTDFDTMPSWSTTFQGLEGDIRDGGQITAIFPLPNGENIAYPHLLNYTENESFGWSDPIIGLDGIVDNHMYTVTFCGNQTEFIQTDEFSGNNQNVSALTLATIVLTDYQIFNQELKAEVEKKFN